MKYILIITTMAISACNNFSLPKPESVRLIDSAHKYFLIGYTDFDKSKKYNENSYEYDSLMLYANAYYAYSDSLRLTSLELGVKDLYKYHADDKLILDSLTQKFNNIRGSLLETYYNEKERVSFFKIRLKDHKISK
jgi:hypothetical protein